MNRIILIGNGFDLAHGMKTSYKDFIDDYWEKTIEEIKLPRQENHFENNDIKINWYPSNYSLDNTYEDLKSSLKRENSRLTYKNRFLKIITERDDINKWVDIEDEYYRLLKETMGHPGRSRGYTNIEKLNKDFKIIQDKLAEYLKRVEKQFLETNDSKLKSIKELIGNIVYQKLDYSNFTKIALEEESKMELELLAKDEELLDLGEIINDDLCERRINLINRISKEANPIAEVKRTLRSSTASDYFDINPENILFLNFNYTATDKLYNNTETRDKLFMRYSFNRGTIPTIRSLNIHGSINELTKNPVIFGFGDELDEDYKNIENLNENKYLENIKSINYLETGNYKSLLNFIESGFYEIFIFGHSCGISDRTLLNTMFEHDNCASIRVFYHERENGSDNYSDLVRNISRNFNDKAKMRDRVVNKRSCKKLC